MGSDSSRPGGPFAEQSKVGTGREEGLRLCPCTCSGPNCAQLWKLLMALAPWSPPSPSPHALRV